RRGWLYRFYCFSEIQTLRQSYFFHLKTIHMKTFYRNISTILSINRYVVITTVIGAVISSIFFGWMVYDIHQSALNNSFAVNTDGTVIPLKWVNQKENLEVEALAHIELFHYHFYNLDGS